MSPAPLHAVVYAKDLKLLQEFYRSTLSLTTSEESSNFALLCGHGFELSIVQVPEAIAAEIEVSSPPEAREDTPIKRQRLATSRDK